MTQHLCKTPQVNIIGKIKGAYNFEYQTAYVKYSFKVGENWTLVSGIHEGDTFQSTSSHNKYIPLDHPFDLNYASKSLRGWPKLFIEVWLIDSYGRNSLGGYGIIGLPMASGFYKLDIPCWRPKSTFSDYIIGAHPELIHRDILIASDSRFNFKTESTGNIQVEIDILNKDFGLHGVQLQDKEIDDME
ncbi:hypothetical protein IMG5_196180 [Ichthyophthirius multifiliis]|uniref:B9 domain-containing protein 2 n=1 Tax=Ichthyophthirius multifiliis TaxID=5932 RepID=G0R533_ICHMU|nr:hypothetical protein IMG5_196180 [Ichthyophthirius multifiliis]EGR27435.1 hypothetical protein IMG5_196180 [Ichthyophthirius multifiliis]|eukprot:XP_004024345.1 hypothetical protein IMG5_196180 [Ichthyophthirius multifiliis]